jgi:formylglycine-generating enzyme required for sulfatase activity
MGSTAGDVIEKPVHKVSLSRSFLMSDHELTQCEYQKYWGETPSWSQYSNNLNCEKWDSVTCNFDANGYRMPTEQ